MNNQIKKRLKRTALLCAAALVAGALVGLAQLNTKPAQVTNLPMAGTQVGGPFTLTDQNGNHVTEKSYAGQYRMIYFGFTMCPMVCPTTLQKMAKALQVVGATAQKIQPIMITVDPDRDTPDALKQYVKQFDPRLVGLTGTKADIENVEKSYRVYASKTKSASATDYSFDHSGFVYFLDPDGNLLALYDSDETADAMATDIKTKIQ